MIDFVDVDNLPVKEPFPQEWFFTEQPDSELPRNIQEEKTTVVKDLKGTLSDGQRIMVDEKKEKAYEKVFDYFERAQGKWELKEILADFLNNSFDNISSQILPSDFDSIEFVDNPHELSLLNEVVHGHFHRFYIKLDLKDLTNLSYKLKGSYSSRGMNLNLNFPLDDVGASLIISSQNPEFLIHELAHSMDPYNHERVWKDQILNECVWYYTSVLYPKVTQMTVNGQMTKLVETKLIHIRGSLFDEGYRRQMGLDKEMSFEEYKALVTHVIDVLEKLEKKIWKVELFKELLNSRTIRALEDI